MKVLDEARPALDKETKVTHADFRVTVLGGEALEAKTGKAYEYVAGMARGEAASFCFAGGALGLTPFDVLIHLMELMPQGFFATLGATGASFTMTRSARIL